MKHYLEVLIDHKQQLLDSFTAGALVITMTSFAEGIIKYIGAILTLLLIFRAISGIIKDRIEIKQKRIELKLKQKQLKLEEDVEKTKETNKTI